MTYKSSGTTSVRRARLSDVFALLSIEHDAFPTDRYAMSIIDFIRYIWRNQVLVATLDGKPAGYLAYDVERDGAAYIESIGVYGHARKHGLGGALIRRMKRNFDRISLHVYEKNPAIVFYRNHGFIIYYRQKNFYGSGTAIKMKWHK